MKEKLRRPGKSGTSKEIPMKMKLTILLLMLTLAGVASTVYPQTTTSDLSYKSRQITEWFNTGEQESERSFSFRQEEGTVSLKVQDEGRIGTIPETPDEKDQASGVDQNNGNKYVIVGSPVNNHSNNLQQPQRVTGTVTNISDTPIPGVAVVVKGTTQGTITGGDGKYVIANVPADAILVFSFVGMKSQEIAIAGKTLINVVLEEETIGIEEVVAIGYGTVKKSDLTGSVVSLKSEDLNKGVVTNVNQMLQGRAPGVQVYQNSSEPGGGMNIQIRGVGSVNAGNEPLYVIDGLPVDNSAVIAGVGEGFTASRNMRNPLNSLNPNDIQSIEILKDASATAIYGSRGANGVIMITTKKGSSGKLKVNYDAYYGVQTVAKSLDVLTAQEYQTVLNELFDTGAVNAGVGERVGDIQGDGTDWQDEIYRNAPVQSHNLSLSGGENDTKYFISFGYFDQDGVVISSGIQRYTARLNLEKKSSDKFLFGVNFNSSYVYDDFVPEGVVPNENAGVISSALDFDPTLSVFDESSGRYSISPFITKDNPVALAHGKDAIAKNFRTMGTVFGEYFILPGLSAKLNVGADIASSKRDVFVDSRTQLGNDNNGIGTVISGLLYNYLAEATVNYKKEWSNKHLFNLMAGATTQKFFIERMNANASGFVSEANGTNSLQSGDQTTFGINTSSIPSTLLSYLGRANYSWDDRVLLTATLRADGSSKFGENNKFALFPSTALAWKLGNEEFIKQMNLFSSLKLRASWGQTGNQEIGNFRSLTTFSVHNLPMIYGDKQYTAMAPSRMPNPDLKWETTAQTNFGLDFGFARGRINGSLDYFYRKTTDLLLSLPVPPQTGFTTKLANVGSIENKGWEFSVDSKNLTGLFKWNTNLNLSFSKNKVVDLGGLDRIIVGSLQFTPDISIITPGQVMNSYYGYEITGVWQTGDDFSVSTQNPKPGDWKYKDQLTIDTDGDGVADAADGKITADDRVILGDPLPDFTWGMTNNFSYKGFDLSVYIQGVHGVDLLNNQMVQSLYPINFRRNKMAEPYLNRWTSSNASNEWASLINPSSQGANVINSKTVEDASYIRFQNITLSYNVPVKSVKAISSLSLYVTGNNLLTVTRYSGMDPGANVNGTNDAALRIDYNSYPLARSFMLGVNVGF